MRPGTRAATLALLLLAAPAGAETVTRSFAPASGAEAQALAKAIGGRAVAAGLATPEAARGSARAAGADLAQPEGNRALVVQRGTDHEAAVAQEGAGNALLLVQAGCGAVADLDQAGGERGVVLQWGRPDRAPGPAPS